MANRASCFHETRHEVDVCVVGGGMSGLCAALAAARQGARVALMHDRPVLGGNASSEMRMHITGADRGGTRPNMRETGILEELRLENVCRNPQQSYGVWDTVLFEAARYQPNITLLLNCSCLDATTHGGCIIDVTGWQLTTETYHRVRAAVFVDCSGDGILAPLTGADFRMGREGRDEYGESIAPEKADRRTMGMTCLFQAREHDTPQPFTPPPWACRFPRDEDLPFGAGGHEWLAMGYWWVELGGEYDSIRDSEILRDELLKIVYGVWDHIKNHGDHGAENWALEWIQFLPAKRESRRYLGDHVMTQHDAEAEGRFDDRVAYGGWAMDDHHPAGFRAVELGRPPTVFHPAPSPYGIPYRAMYSRNVDNLMFAGRCASCTHAAMSSTRVMGTCCSMGQAAGAAAAMAAAKGILPRGVNEHVAELQQALLRNDAYIPWIRQEFSALTRNAELIASGGNPEPLRDGINRPVGDDEHCWRCRPGDHVEMCFQHPAMVEEVTLILDSALENRIGISLHAGRRRPMTTVPDVMPREFRLEGLRGGEWTLLAAVHDNHQRLVRLPVGREIEGIRFTLDTTHGAAESRVFAFYAD